MLDNTTVLSNFPALDSAAARVLTDIARVSLDIADLSDALDSHTVSVWCVRNALQQAFEAGQTAARSR